jgi:hypothetical protein
MQEPTLENLAEESKQYRQYLEAGGKPFYIHLELIPKDKSWDWTIQTGLPVELRHLTWARMFTVHIKEVIIRAIQPPPEQPTQQQGNN